MNATENIPMLAANSIRVIDRFLAGDECDRLLLAIDSGRWRKSRLWFGNAQEALEGSYAHVRNSDTVYESGFDDELAGQVRSVQDRVVAMTGLIADRMEGWQITRYRQGEKFEPHLDAGVDCGDGRGDREWTVLIYLCEPEVGGETLFRALNCVVRPNRGRLVVWNNLLPTGLPNYAMIHGGRPVQRGVKVILHTWFREKS